MALCFNSSWSGVLNQSSIKKYICALNNKKSIVTYTICKEKSPTWMVIALHCSMSQNLIQQVGILMLMVQNFRYVIAFKEVAKVVKRREPGVRLSKVLNSPG